MTGGAYESVSSGQTPVGKTEKRTSGGPGGNRDRRILAGNRLGIGSGRSAAEKESGKCFVEECYAMEGRYPESLAYIEDHYGLL